MGVLIDVDRPPCITLVATVLEAERGRECHGQAVLCEAGGRRVTRQEHASCYGRQPVHLLGKKMTSVSADWPAGKKKKLSPSGLGQKKNEEKIHGRPV
jgi:hypothetical protein